MFYYFIDYENVHFAGIEGIGDLESASNVVYLYYSEHASTIGISFFDDIKKNPALIDCINIVRADVGYPNALDFSLCGCVSAHLNKKDTFIIVSSDKGYLYFREGLKRFGYSNVYCCTSIKQARRLVINESIEHGEPPCISVNSDAKDDLDATTLKSAEPAVSLSVNLDMTKKSLESQLQQYLQEKTGVLVELIDCKILISGFGKSADKAGLYNYLRAEKGNENGLRIYRYVKKCYNDAKVLCTS